MMFTLVRYETAKLLRRPVSILALLVLGVLTLFSGCSDSYMTETTIYCSSGQCVYGMQAVRENIRTASAYTGVLSDETISAIIHDFSSAGCAGTGGTGSKGGSGAE